MAYWLLKTEPSTYSYDDLAKDKKTVWDGITNFQALSYLKKMKKGDKAFIYHTGDEKQIVGLAEVTKEAYPDPKQNNEKLVVVELKALKKVKNNLTLSEVKADKRFTNWKLVRNSRLSVMPVDEDILKIVEEKTLK